MKELDLKTHFYKFDSFWTNQRNFRNHFRYQKGEEVLKTQNRTKRSQSNNIMQAQSKQQHCKHNLGGASWKPNQQAPPHHHPDTAIQ